MSSRIHKLCVSILPTSLQELKEWLPQLSEADLIEIRLDFIPQTKLKAIRSLTNQPLIITLRSRQEGGHWEGSRNDYIKIIKSAINAKIDYVDVEWGSAAEVYRQISKWQNTGRILSHHTDETSLEVLKDKLHRMRDVEAEVYKLVFPAHSFKENCTALKIIEVARSMDMSFVVHATGEEGQLSRIIGAVRGNCWTYVAFQPDRATAPGQLALHEAANYYHLQRKSTATKLIGLVGFPLHQSKGWRLHNELIHRNRKAIAGNNGDFLYLNFPVEDLDAFWKEWNASLHGLSITIPYKEKIVPYLDELSTDVRISGVCNTALRTSRGWKGFNTDLIALETLLRPHREVLREGALVVGTGATARSAIAALKRLEVSHIFVVGRNVERGRLLADKFNVEFLEEEEVHYAGASAVIQTTPVGMVPYTDRYPVGSSLFRRDRVVLDVIYNPPVTRFLKIARDRGCTTISGVEMFLLQAAKQFELFTGVPLTLEEVRKVWEEIV